MLQKPRVDPMTPPEHDAQKRLSQHLLVFTLQDAYQLARGNLKYFHQSGESRQYILNKPRDFFKRLSGSIRDWITTDMFAYMCQLADVDRDLMEARIRAVLKQEGLDVIAKELAQYNAHSKGRPRHGKRRNQSIRQNPEGREAHQA